MEQVQLKRITISISQVAPLIGLDNYNNFPRIVCELWRRYNPIEFRNFELRLKNAGHHLANSSNMNDIWEVDNLLGTNIIERVKNLNENKNKTSNEMVKSQKEIKEYIEQQKELTTEQKDTIINKMCSITNTCHGITNEDAILAEFCRLSDKKIVNSQEWMEIPILQDSDTGLEWIFVGKYDGITTDGELVEAKMRQKGLFKKMRDYENVQVQLYLHALGFSNGYLVEGFTSSNKKNKNSKSSSDNTITDKTTKLELYTHEVAYDSSYVEDTILDRVKQFIKFFNFLMQGDNANTNTNKETLLKGDLHREIFKYFQEHYLGIESIDF